MLIIYNTYPLNIVFPGDSDGEELALNTRDLGSIPMLGSSPRDGNGNPLQYSWQENPMNRGSWWDIVHGVTKSQLDTTEWLTLSLSMRKGKIIHKLKFVWLLLELSWTSDSARNLSLYCNSFYFKSLDSIVAKNYNSEESSQKIHVGLLYHFLHFCMFEIFSHNNDNYVNKRKRGLDWGQNWTSQIILK